MDWYWIVLIALGYMAMWIATAVFAYEMDAFDIVELSVAISMFWPVILPVLMVTWIVKKITYYL